MYFHINEICRIWPKYVDKRWSPKPPPGPSLNLNTTLQAWGAIAPLLGNSLPPKCSPDSCGSTVVAFVSCGFTRLFQADLCVTAYTAPNWSLSRFVSWPWGTLTSSSCEPFGYVRAGPSLFFPLWRLSIPPWNRVRPSSGQMVKGFPQGCLAMCLPVAPDS